MSSRPKSGKPDDLKGSELHHELKNRPGEHADEDHATDESPSDVDALPEDVRAAIQDGEGETDIAQQLKAAVDDDARS